MSLRLPGQEVIDEAIVKRARDLWDEIEPEIKEFLE
jgi:hypothetical protein